MKLNYNQWKSIVTNMMENYLENIGVGLQMEDIPDLPYKISWEDDYTPMEFYKTHALPMLKDLTFTSKIKIEYLKS